MADNIILSSSVRNNLLSLQNTARLLETTQNHLASGLKINSALDDPSAFFTASSLNSRANDLNRLLDDVGLAVQTLEAADKGLSAITDLVEAAQATAQNALQASAAVTTNASTTGTIGITLSDVAATTTGTGAAISADAAAAATGATDINIADLTTLAGVNNNDQFSVNGVTITITTGESGTTLAAAIDAIAGISAQLNGATGFLEITADDAETAIVIADVTGTPTGATGLNISATTYNPTNLLTQGISQNDTLTIKVGCNTTQTITFGTGTSEVGTLAELQAAVSALAGSNGIASASVDATGNISLTATSNVDSIVFGGNTGSNFGLASDNVTVNPSSATLVNNGVVSQSDTLIVTTGSGTTTITFGTGTNEVNTLSALSTALNNISGISASVAATTGYLTISADSPSTSFTLSGTGGPAAFGLSTTAQSSTTTANATRTAAETQFNNLLSQINTLAADARFNGNNLLTGGDLSVIFNEDGSSSLTISGVTFTAAGLGLSSVTTGDFQSNTNINTTLDSLESAISTLRTQAATFGSNLSVVQIRQDFTRQLIDVLETGAGNLTLADTSREGANLLALQTRQALSSTSLGIAARAEYSVLQLLR